MAGSVNDLQNISLKFRAQFGLTYEIVVMVSLGRKTWQGFPYKLCEGKHVF
jgi:hypothetical protein